MAKRKDDVARTGPVPFVGSGAQLKRLQEAQASVVEAERRLTDARERRDVLARQAIASGWTYAAVADALGMTRGWVSGQLLKDKAS